MSQVILYNLTNNGITSVFLCTPTGEVDIEAVKEKDIPFIATDVSIVDYLSIPEKYHSFHDAWIWNGTNLTIDIDKAKEYYLSIYNQSAIKEAQKRQLNTLTGVKNVLDDATWQAKLENDRASIEKSSTIDDLIVISLPYTETNLAATGA